jgi:predicted GNAT superfamily acetyltransferase
VTSNRTPVTVRPLRTPEELRRAVGLYRDVLGLNATDPAVSPRLLAGLLRNGGSVIGAFAAGSAEDGDETGADRGADDSAGRSDDGDLIGFAYGFIGRDPATGEMYHYSQTAVVATAWQGRGVGRRLKLGQRAYVLETGLTRMRWSYDPVRASNAHFNLDVLGARGRWFVRNFYGIDDMGRDRGQPSDRVIVDWDLVGPPTPPAVPSPLTVRSQPTEPSQTTGPSRGGAGDVAGGTGGGDANGEQAPPFPGWGETVRFGADLLIGVPRHWADVAADPDRARRVRAAVSDAMEAAVTEGYVACSCQVPRLVEAGASRPDRDDPVSANTAVYVLRKETR